MNVFGGSFEAPSNCGYCYDEATSCAFFVLGERLSIDEGG
jgi:hypothetical protein